MRKLLTKLQKLDLKCYPCEGPPSWLQPRNLPNLKKLYIRGGTLQNLSPDEWKNVEVLRLKFLSNLKMDYKKLRSSFPSLIYLENFKCPKLTYFPCNENGVIRLK
jgi:Leucine-rich repeat (LRR) protein